MSKKKAAIMSILGYLITMVIGVLIGRLVTNLLGSNVMGSMQINGSNILYKIIIQIPSTVFLIHMIKKYYRLEDIGLSSSIKIGKIIWLLPYIIILFLIGEKFIEEFYKNMQYYDIHTYILIILTFIGTVMAGFSEEIIFRGIILNSFKKDKSIIGAMLISSIGFSIVHISTIIMGESILSALGTVFYSSLLGFAFVGLAMIVKSIWFLCIFHTLWNFILIMSQTLKIELSSLTGMCNILNIVMAILLWSIVLMSNKKVSKKYSKKKVS